MLGLLLEEGITPSSRLLDVGCGALRLGYWAMRLLDPGHYYAIEPNIEMRDVGLALIEEEVIRRAEPHFSENDDFDFSVFGEEFDFVFAGSVWTHASRQQIRTMLASFATSSSPSGVLLASYGPTSRVWRQINTRYPRAASEVASRLPLTELSPLIARLPSKEAPGERWEGRSHESQMRGVNKRSLRWLAKECSCLGLEVALRPFRPELVQFWLRIRRAGRGRSVP
jgi:SAM-dependent methyltransferase